MATSITIPANAAVSRDSSSPASTTMRANLPDRRRTWLWMFLVAIAASQLYFVRELLAAFALFAIVFAAIALLVTSLYLFHKFMESVLTRLAALRHPVMSIASVGDIASVGSENRKAA